MTRETSSGNTGTQIPDITPEAVMERFKLGEKEYKALPLLCQVALKEAISITSMGTGLTNMFMVYATNYDGESVEAMVCARDGHDAIGRFMCDHGYESDYEWESPPIAHQLPAVHRFGVVNCGSCPSTVYRP